MTVTVDTIKFLAPCQDCNLDVTLEFLPDGVLHAVDDRDYYGGSSSSSVRFSTDCGHYFYWNYQDAADDPMYWMMVAKYNWEPVNATFGYLSVGPDGHINAVQTVRN